MYFTFQMVNNSQALRVRRLQYEIRELRVRRLQYAYEIRLQYAYEIRELREFRTAGDERAWERG